MITRQYPTAWDYTKQHIRVCVCVCDQFIYIYINCDIYIYASFKSLKGKKKTHPFVGQTFKELIIFV